MARAELQTAQTASAISLWPKAEADGAEQSDAKSMNILKHSAGASKEEP